MNERAAEGGASERDWINDIKNEQGHVSEHTERQKILITDAMSVIFKSVGVKSPQEIQEDITNGKLHNFDEICTLIILTLNKIKKSLKDIYNDEQILEKFYNQLDNKENAAKSLREIKADYKQIVKRVETYITYWEKSKSASKVITSRWFWTENYRLANTPVRGYIKKILNKDEGVNEEMLKFLNLAHQHKYA